VSRDVSPDGALVAAALARKYHALAALRARRDGDGPAATRAELRALAAEFPGCLRELDTLGATELARRERLCAAGAHEPWMDWIAAYHARVRAALAARAGGTRVRASEGRLNVEVLRALAKEFDVPAAEIAATLFPVRRPSPYRL
jgi:hypothetical protein